MATMSLGLGPSRGNITGDEGDAATDQAVDQDPDSDPGADQASGSAQPDFAMSKDDADTLALQYPALDGSIEPSSSPVMSVSVIPTQRLLHC